MSAERPNENNDYRTDLLGRMLDEFNVTYHEVIGYYKGQREVSFMVMLDKDFTVEFFESLAKKFDQECILYRDKYNECYLHYTCPYKKDYNEKLDGSFKQVESVENLDAYSIIGGKFYAVS